VIDRSFSPHFLLFLVVVVVYSVACIIEQ